jgi:hypothetical protein
MILGGMIDVVMWESVILSASGLYMPIQCCFSSDNTSAAGARFGHSGPKSIILPSFVFFCELITGLEFFWHSEK